MTAFETWGSYFYPPPDSATLRNVQGIRDPDGLAVFEYEATALRQMQLLMDLAALDRTFDAAHVSAIHGFLFRDVYEWAGRFRTVNFTREGRVRDFADVRAGEIDRYLADMTVLVADTPWQSLNLDAFARAAAAVCAHLNQAHPFREGNGRTTKVFMEHVAGLSSFTLDFGAVDDRTWNMASELSRPDIGSYEVVPDSLVPVFRAIAADRTA